jgi:hypothetical protein
MHFLPKESLASSGRHAYYFVHVSGLFYTEKIGFEGHFVAKK